MSPARLIVLVVALSTAWLVPLAAGALPAAQAPRAAADSLLATDLAFSSAAAQTDLVSGVAAMFDEQVVLPRSGGRFTHGREEAVAALSANPDNRNARATWTPVRVGVSADGRHGFSFGFMTVRQAGKPDISLKYLAYWVRGADGWRVRAYKRAGHPEGKVSTRLREPALPPRAWLGHPSDRARHAKSLAATEQAFSDESQIIGLNRAFAKYGRPDAMNMGQGPDFAIGADQIAAGFGPPESGSPVRWSADEGVVVADSGDLGVTFGRIRPSEGDGEAAAFFTVWRRDRPEDPWRYVAE